MNVYTTDKIRNVVLLGHGGAGKTSLVEAMAYLSGITNRMGKISDGNTISDYDKEEIKRKFSINYLGRCKDQHIRYSWLFRFCRRGRRSSECR